jgi:hypothetical protein
LRYDRSGSSLTVSDVVMPILGRLSTRSPYHYATFRVKKWHAE